MESSTAARDRPWYWEIAYWRAFPVSEWVVIAHSRHSVATLRLLRGLWERQPDVMFRLRRCPPPQEIPEVSPYFISWQAAS